MEEDKRIKNFLETTISCLKGNNDGYVKVYKYNLEILENILNGLERLQKENEELSESHNYIYDVYQDAGKKMFDYQEQLNDSIPKQVLRDEIKKRKKHCTVINSFVIEALEELLGE